VNSAARLCELAKGHPAGVLADGSVVALAGQEADEWEPCGETVLRGRTASTLLSRPRPVRRP
jgi:adenylate cyclase